jgi:hypothetical protein
MGIFDDLGNFVAQVEAAEARIQQQQNGLNINTPAQAAAAGGTGYHVTPEELQSLLAQWKDLDDTLRQAINNVSPKTSTDHAPATDTASIQAGDAVTATFGNYMAHLQAMESYAANYVTSLEKALQNYQEAEAGNRGSATNVQTSLKS